MNKEITKAMNRKPNKAIIAIKDWWHKNGYKVMRVILFPIWIALTIKEKYEKKIYSELTWSEERANEFLNYWVPRRAEWDAEKKQFSICFNDFGWCWGYNKKCVKCKDRTFWKKFGARRYSELAKYLIDSFELDGFTKIIGEWNHDGWIDVTFTMDEPKD